MPTAILQYDGLWFRVDADDPQDLVWLREFLCPQFELGRTEPWDVRITLRRDGLRYQDVVAAHDAAADVTLDAFALDTGVVRLPAWRGADSSETLFDRAFAVLYHVGADRRSVEILAEESNRRARIPLMRVVREFAMNCSMDRGGLFLHASCFFVGGRGILVAGPSAAGKTTLLIHALSQTGVDYVSNDRVLVRPSVHPVPLRGMPTIVTVRESTLALMPQLAQTVEGTHFYHASTIAESQRDRRRLRAWPDGRFGFSPAQFLALVGAKPVAEATASAILMPSQTGRPGGIELEPLGADEATPEMLGAVLGIRTWAAAAPVFALPSESIRQDESLRADLCRQLLVHVPCFRCRLGTDAYQTPAPLQRLIGRLS